MDKRPSSTTLYIHAASQSPLALVIRRGPSKWWHFLLWDRDTGVISPGSWFNGMLYPHRCDLAPHGDWMVMLAFMGAGNPCAWTALCRPPNARAVCFWPQASAKYGGGFFDARQPVLWLNTDARIMTPEVHEKHPFEFGNQDKDQPIYGSFADRLQRDSWKLVAADKKTGVGKLVRWHKRSPKKDFELILDYDAALQGNDLDMAACEGVGVSYAVRAFKAGSVTVPLQGVSWANWNRRGELCLAESGALFIAPAKSPLTSRRLVVDLRGLSPRPRKASTKTAAGVTNTP